MTSTIIEKLLGFLILMEFVELNGKVTNRESAMFSGHATYAAATMIGTEENPAAPMTTSVNSYKADILFIAYPNPTLGRL